MRLLCWLNLPVPAVFGLTRGNCVTFGAPKSHTIGVDLRFRRDMLQRHDHDVVAWKHMESAARERERIIASLRQELSCLEDLTGRMVATLSGHGQAMSPMSPAKPSAYWSPPVVVSHPVHLLGAAPVSRPVRSQSTPQLQAPEVKILQAPLIRPAPGLSGSPSRAQRVSAPPQQRVLGKDAMARVQGKRAYPKEPAQTPPHPRPLVHL